MAEEEKKDYIRAMGEAVEVPKELYFAYYRMLRQEQGLFEKDEYNAFRALISSRSASGKLLRALWSSRTKMRLIAASSTDLSSFEGKLSTPKISPASNPL